MDGTTKAGNADTLVVPANGSATLKVYPKPGIKAGDRIGAINITATTPGTGATPTTVTAITSTIEFEVKQPTMTFTVMEAVDPADPEKDVAVSEIDFGTAEADYTDAPAAVVLRIANTGNTQFTAKVTVPNDGKTSPTKYFTDTMNPNTGVVKVLPETPKASDYTTLTIQPVPSATAKAGDYSGNVVISNGLTGDDLVEVTVPVKVTVAEKDAKFTVNGAASDVTVEFDNVVEDGYKLPDPQEITIANAGNTVLTIQEDQSKAKSFKIIPRADDPETTSPSGRRQAERLARVNPSHLRSLPVIILRQRKAAMKVS